MLCSARLSFLLCWIGGPDKEAFVVAPDDPECTAPTWLITLTLLLPLDHKRDLVASSLTSCVCVYDQSSYASHLFWETQSLYMESVFIEGFC